LLFLILNNQKSYLRGKRLKMICHTLIKPRRLQSHPRDLKRLTLIEFADKITDAAGADDARLANAVVTDSVPSGKTGWAGPLDLDSACGRV